MNREKTYWSVDTNYGKVMKKNVRDSALQLLLQLIWMI